MNQFQGVPGPSQDAFNSLSEQIGTKVLSTSLLIARAGYTFSDVRITKSGNIVTITASVSGSIGENDTYIGEISSSLADGIKAFGGARYGVSGTYSCVASVMLLANRQIRIHGNHSNSGDFADFTLVFAV